MRKVFVLLTGGAPFYVLFQPLLCSRPEVLPLYCLYGFISSGVSTPVVPVLCNLFSDFVVWWNYEFVCVDCPPSSML